MTNQYSGFMMLFLFQNLQKFTTQRINLNISKIFKKIRRLDDWYEMWKVTKNLTLLKMYAIASLTEADRKLLT